MNLWDAPFDQPLRVLDLQALPEEVRLVLVQLGLDTGEMVLKKYIAPLGDPISIMLGSQQFSLRAQICRSIQVEV